MNTAAPVLTATPNETPTGPKFAVDVSLQQDYRLGGPVKVTNSFACIPSADGVGTAIVAFTSDNRLVLIDHDVSSETGWALTNLGYPAGYNPSQFSLAAYRGADGAVVVYLLPDLTHVYRASSADNWAWDVVDLTGQFGYPGSAYTYATLHSQQSSSAGPGVAVLIVYRDDNGKWSEVTVWSSADDASTRSRSPRTPPRSVWCGAGPPQVTIGYSRSPRRRACSGRS
jgi:hypothetical protein